MSVSSHNVGLPALEVRRPECTGYLLKVGNRRKTWQRRYCILKDACLYYYKNMNSLSALGQYGVVYKSFLLCFNVDIHRKVDRERHGVKVIRSR